MKPEAPVTPSIDVSSSEDEMAVLIKKSNDGVRHRHLITDLMIAVGLACWMGYFLNAVLR